MNNCDRHYSCLSPGSLLLLKTLGLIILPFPSPLPHPYDIRHSHIVTEEESAACIKPIKREGGEKAVCFVLDAKGEPVLSRVTLLH